MRTMFTVLIFLLGFIPCCLAGYLCQTTFPGRGFCLNRPSACPASSPEYSRLSNFLGCPSSSQRCCITGGSQVPQQTDRSQCGKGSWNTDLAPRILNGVIAGPCDWPFVVSIRSLLRDKTQLDYSSTTHQCGGVIIHPSWVLTNPVCVLNAGNTASEAPRQFVVVAGEYNKSGIDINPLTGRQQEQIIGVERVIIHPKYAYQSRDQISLNDVLKINGHGVALIKLAQPLTGSCSGQICLPTVDEAKDNCSVYNDCVITGWGFTSSLFKTDAGQLDILKQGRVRLTSKKGCDLVTVRLQRTASRFAGSICQVPTNVVTSGCLGDEGGAVMCSDGKNWVVRGILPSAICLNDNQFDLYVTDVSQYLPWIQTTMATHGV